jgi:hypothetical protein
MTGSFARPPLSDSVHAERGEREDAGAYRVRIVVHGIKLRFGGLLRDYPPISRVRKPFLEWDGMGRPAPLPEHLVPLRGDAFERCLS